MRARVWCGLDRIETIDHLLRNRRIGLMTNQTGISHDFKSTVDIFLEKYQLTALLACEHGIRGDMQAGEGIRTFRDEETGVMVYATYGNDHRLTPEMLAAFDALVFDMQDVGVRFYTYLYSLSYAMEECAKAGKPVIVLDRLNPTGAVKTAGTILDPRFSSFVGQYELPTRHGLTIGEYALYVKDYMKLDIDLTVVKMDGYKREYFLEDTDTPWPPPSPNCPAQHTAMAYIGTCIFEGSNVSEGRGTALPFELIGAPWIDSMALEKRMREEHIPGIRFRRASFMPAFSKSAGILCKGVQMHITDREIMEPFMGAMMLMDAIRELHPEEFRFSELAKRFTIDILLGTDEYRRGLCDGKALTEKHRPIVEQFARDSMKYHLYV